MLDIIDRMIAQPAAPRPTPEPSSARHAGAAAASPPASVPTSPILAPKGISVERTVGPKDPLDEAAELFKTIFKGDILP